MLILAPLMGVGLTWLLAWAAEGADRLAMTTATSGEAIQRPPLALASVLRGPASASEVVRAGCELLSAAVFGLVWWRLGPDGMAILAGYAFLLAIALIDLRHRLVLNVMLVPALAIILVVQAANGADALRLSLVGVGFALVCFLPVWWLKPGQLGAGDVKLAGVLGALLGFPGIMAALLIGGGLGAAVAMSLLARGVSPQRSLPYAPFLCLGALGPYIMQVL
ncbi:MAG: prepilin peptidase [Anaerolineales bacterium]